MLLDLSEILARVGLHRTHELAEPPIDDGAVACVQPITGTLSFTNAGSALILSGSAATTVRLECSRCLTEIDEPINVEISEQFALSSAPVGTNRRGTVPHVEEDESRVAGGLFAGAMLDVTELLRQALWLALPTQPLHSEDCRGLCPQCGHDLNTGPCGCVQVAWDPRMSALADLLHRPGSDPSQH